MGPPGPRAARVQRRTGARGGGFGVKEKKRRAECGNCPVHCALPGGRRRRRRGGAPLPARERCSALAPSSPSSASAARRPGRPSAHAAPSPRSPALSPRRAPFRRDRPRSARVTRCGKKGRRGGRAAAARAGGAFRRRLARVRRACLRAPECCFDSRESRRVEGRAMLILSRPRRFCAAPSSSASRAQRSICSPCGDRCVWLNHSVKLQIFISFFYCLHL